MTPYTWSLEQIFMRDAVALSSVERHPLYGKIGGRFYMNLSLLATIGAAFGMTRLLDETNEQAVGRRPGDLEVPLIRMSSCRLLCLLLLLALCARRRISADLKRMPTFLAASPARCEALRVRIKAASSVHELADLWRPDLEPSCHECSFMLRAAKQDGNALVRIRRDLRKLVGDAEANALTTGLHASGSELASLGLLVGLAQLGRGDIDRATFARQGDQRRLDLAVPACGRSCDRRRRAAIARRDRRA